MCLSVAIVDDEAAARGRMRGMLALERNLEVVAEADSGAAAIEILRGIRPDLVFMDVQMPDMDGFATLMAIDSKERPAIVFVSEHDGDAIQAFDAGALDYIRKPVTQLRVSEAVRRARAVVTPDGSSAGGSETVSGRYLRRFTVRSGERTLFVDISAVNWLEAAGNYTVLHTACARHVLRETLKDVERQICPETFHRVSRSAIVHLGKVREIRTASAGHHIVALQDRTEIVVSRSVREIERKFCSS